MFRNRVCVNFIIALTVFSISGSLIAEDRATGWTADSEMVKKFESRSSSNNGGRDFIYSEKKVPEYSLPDILTTNSGEKVTAAKEWESTRRPEILELFRRHVYGRNPVRRPEQMSFDVYDVDPEAMDGKATRKQVKITFRNNGKSLLVNVVIFIPNDAEHPVPAFLLICNRDKTNIDPTRENKIEYWPAEDIVARGYAAVAFHNADVDPDNYDKFQNGIHALYDEGERHDDAWATLAAWAWGASRVLDYLETDRMIDAKHVAVVGHSRGGKTSLWAGATDERFAMVVSNNSGCGGAALSRRQYGETVGRINRAFPHWFCEKFSEYNENEGELPVDQHMLLSLAAPRLLYVTSADEDLWADPRGEFLSAKEASVAYELYGKTGLGTNQMPALNEPVQQGNIGYHVRSGGHGLTLYDWTQFMNFTDKHWKR
ncbi:alpha/beta hydrolase family protein [uncultured Rubinisphaera sp.]|uniref:glucuronyl esterase domain-containing protein n=1 Tax=uncultured Rubinisphaera sp. TaxID=1678686 RepID=UPI0030DB64E3